MQRNGVGRIYHLQVAYVEGSSVLERVLRRLFWLGIVAHLRVSVFAGITGIAAIIVAFPLILYSPRDMCKQVLLATIDPQTKQRPHVCL